MTNEMNNVPAFPLLQSGGGKLVPTIRLSSGYDMPVVGLGTCNFAKEATVQPILSALRLGYRKIDTAYLYENEAEVGEAVRRSGVPREDIFVATKLYPNQYANAEAAIEQALRKLDVGYIDLLMLHHPSEIDVETYKTMERYVADGRVRSLGLSCYYRKEIDRFLPKVDIKPVLVQNEVHPYYQDTDVVEHLHELDIAVEAWYPLGGKGRQSELLSDAALTRIAERHGKSVAQVILRWHLQRGVVVVPGSGDAVHQEQNLSLFDFDFELTKEEMRTIASLDRNEKHDWY